MKNLLYILILISFSCSLDNPSYEKNYNTKVVEELPSTEIGTIEAFINNLGEMNYKAAYNKSKVKLWGNYEKFSSTKAFGGIVETRIDKIEQLANENGKAVVYVEAFYADKVNGNNNYKQKFFLQQFGTDWKIVGMKLIGSKKAKSANINYSGEYLIENRGTYVTVSKHLSLKKIKKNQYSFRVTVVEGSDDEQMEAGGMGDFFGDDEGVISIVSGKAQYKREGIKYDFVFFKSSVKLSVEEEELMWRISPDGTYKKK